MKEIFKDVPNFPNYMVSNHGRVKTIEKHIEMPNGGLRVFPKKILKQIKGKNYHNVRLCNNGKCKSFNIHQLVAIVFLNHKPNGHTIVVDHIDNDKSNNHVSNLQLISQRENLSKDKQNGSSKHVGVHWSKHRNKWSSQIQIKGKIKHLGLFNCETIASIMYQKQLKSLT